MTSPLHRNIIISIEESKEDKSKLIITTHRETKTINREDLVPITSNYVKAAEFLPQFQKEIEAKKALEQNHISESVNTFLRFGEGRIGDWKKFLTMQKEGEEIEFYEDLDTFTVYFEDKGAKGKTYMLTFSSIIGVDLDVNELGRLIIENGDANLRQMQDLEE